MNSSILYELILNEISNKNLYILLKKLSIEMNNSEYTLHKLNNFKLFLNSKLEETILYKNLFNSEIIVIILEILKKSFIMVKNDKRKSINLSMFEQKKEKDLKKRISSPNISVENIEINDIDYENPYFLNGIILEQTLGLVLELLSFPVKNNFSTNMNNEKFLIGKIEEILVNSNNFVLKFLDDPLRYQYDQTIHKTVNFFLKF